MTPDASVSRPDLIERVTAALDLHNGLIEQERRNARIRAEYRDAQWRAALAERSVVPDSPDLIERAIDLWWTTCHDVWAVPDDGMVAYGRAALAYLAQQRQDVEAVAAVLREHALRMSSRDLFGVQEAACWACPWTGDSSGHATHQAEQIAALTPAAPEEGRA